MTKQKLTSVKVDIESWNSFRKISIDEEITFRQLVHISLKEFVNNKKFRKTIREKVTDYGKEKNIIIS